MLTALEFKGLSPAAAANKRTLIRRATLDLHGLPPTTEEIHDFLIKCTARSDQETARTQPELS